MDEEYIIHTDKTQLDIEFIHHYLSSVSYWAKGRTIETVKTSIDNSICFGVYLGNEQVGFARVISDNAIYAWLIDLFITDEHQSKGLGKKLMQSIMNHPELKSLKRWGLRTLDAHKLYEQYGFIAMTDIERHMQYVPNKTS